MPGRHAGDFELTDDDVLSLLDDGLLVEDPVDEVVPLQGLSRRISGQYVDVLAGFAAGAFAGRRIPDPAQVTAAADALVRLARASGDEPLLAAVEQLRHLVPRVSARGGRARQAFMRELQEWVLGFAALLDSEDGSRMRQLVSFDDEVLPLLDALGDIRGIGPKRLQRLYCAGLFTLDVLGRADPEEVALVTGLPGHLAADVVRVAHRFAEEERRRCAQDLRRRTRQVRATIRSLRQAGIDDAELVSAARNALSELETLLAGLGAKSEGP